MARFDDVADASAVWMEGRLKQGFDGDVAVDDIDGPVAAGDVLLLNKAADGVAFGAIKPAQPTTIRFKNQTAVRQASAVFRRPRNAPARPLLPPHALLPCSGYCQ